MGPDKSEATHCLEISKENGARCIKGNYLYGYRTSEVELPPPKDLDETCFAATKAYKTYDPYYRPPVACAIAPVLPAVPPKPDTSNPDNLIAGVSKRMATTPRPYRRRVRRHFRKFVARWVKENLEPLPAGHFSNWSDPGTPSLKNPKIPLQPGYLESWLSQTNYPEWRKKELRLAYDNIQNDEGLYKFTDNIHKHGVVKIFVKDEFYPEFKYPRAIWARQDEFKVIAGPIFKEIEKKLFDLPYFIKKVPKQDRPKFLHEFLECDDFIYQGTDYTSYEAHFNEDMQDDCEFELYRHMMQHNDHLKKVLHMIFQVTATYNLIKNKYFTLMTYAKRMSGEMNTSLGNGFSNLMFLKFGLHRYKIPHKGPVVEGDDALLSLKTQLPQEYYDEMGLNVKLEVFDTLGEASFCGNVFSSDELINITEPIYYLCTTPWLSKLYTHAGPKKKWELTKCKALSLAWEYPGDRKSVV